MFDFIWRFTLEKEGGLCDDPGDPGGITKYGVDLRMLKDFAKGREAQKFLGAHGVFLPINRDTIIRLTKEQAAEIYRHIVWDAMGLRRLPDTVAYVLFDTGVLHGNTAAIRFVQRGHNHLFPKYPLVVDGKLGPRTVAAIEADREMDLAKATLNEREGWYYRHVKAVPSQQKFLKGWLNRVEDLRKYLGLKK